MAVAGQNTRRPLAGPQNYCESKQTYFSYSLDKAFHSPEFQAKLFVTRNWVGGFYWDSLLIFGVQLMYPEPRRGGVNACEGGADARRKFWIKSLKETDLGVAQVFFDP